MPRPQLGIGQNGHINTKRHGAVFVAMARYRDADGVTRRVKAQGKSKGAAEAALRDKFDARDVGGADLNGESRVSELAELYYADRQREGLSPNTLYNHRSRLDNHIIPRLGGLRIREASPPRLQTVIAAISEGSGPGAARGARSTLSGMFALAATLGVVQVNPVQHVPTPKTGGKKIRVLSPQDLIKVRTHAVQFLRPFTMAERLERAGGDMRRVGGKNRNPRLLDMIDFLLATGCRASEVAGTAWADVHLDDEVPWVEIRQQVVRFPGEGLRLAPTKEGDERRLRLPWFAVEMLRRRRMAAAGPMVFPSERGGLLHYRTISAAWRNTFRGTEWAWVTPKTLRKTVATAVAEQFGASRAAGQLGNTESVARKHYIAPSELPVDNREVLELFEVHMPETGRLEISADFGAETG